MTEQQGQAVLAVPVDEHDHIRGTSNAPVTLVEYGDYECPYCGEAYAAVKQLQEEMGNQVRFVFRNFPITEAHPHAEQAAEAAEAAADQGKFWEMHDFLFEHQRALDEEHLAEYARILSLSDADLERELEEGTERGRVREDAIGGLESGVEGTPTFFINGVRYDGSYDTRSLRAAIEEAAAQGA